MNIFQWLEKMRNKPERTQRVAAFGVALSATGLLFVMWLAVLMPQVLGKEEIAQKNNELETPKDTIVQNIRTAWGAVGEQIRELKTGVAQVNLSAALQYTTATTSPEQPAVRVVSTTPLSITSTADASVATTTTP